MKVVDRDLCALQRTEVRLIHRERERKRAREREVSCTGLMNVKDELWRGTKHVVVLIRTDNVVF